MNSPDEEVSKIRPIAVIIAHTKYASENNFANASKKHATPTPATPTAILAILFLTSLSNHAAGVGSPELSLRFGSFTA